MAEEEISAEFLDSLERRLEDCRNQFEQYFMGVRKRAPLQDRTSIQYAIRRASNQTISNTRLRFRFQQLVSKFNSYNSYWNRSLQQLEAGTHFRDRFKAKKAAASPPPPPTSSSKPKPKSGGVDDNHIDQVYNDFIQARKDLKQSTNVSKDKLADSIKKQMPALEQRYKGKDIKFKVVVEDGKAKLKATIK